MATRVCTLSNIRQADVGRAGEQDDADHQVAGPLGGHPQHHDEQREEQQRRAEVLLPDHDHDARTPRRRRSAAGGAARAGGTGRRCHVPLAISSRRSAR